jgi:tetrahydromethanopterin S-methyltransferase subunit A
MQDQRHAPTPGRKGRPAIVGDVVFGSMESPVAVCTLGSRSLLAELVDRPEIAVAGRVFTENVGVERMIQNLAAFERVRYLIVCGRETRHRVGQTILALYRDGVDGSRRVVGSDAPDPLLPNLSADQLRQFQERVEVVDMIGVVDAKAIVERASALTARPEISQARRPTAARRMVDSGGVDVVVATRDPSSSWTYDPAGYFLIFVDRARRLLCVEHRMPDHRLIRVFEGGRAEDLCHTIVRRGDLTLLAHAAYLGRELAKAETALTLGLEYDQDRPLVRATGHGDSDADGEMEDESGDGAGDRRAP